MTEKLLYPREADLYAKIVTQIRRAYTESIDPDLREQKVHGVISMGFDNLLEIYQNDSLQKSRNDFFNAFFEELFKNMPELNFGVGMEEMARLECVFQFGVTWLYGL